MILAYFRLLIYPRRFEEQQFGCLPGLWSIESRANGRAEESSGILEGGDTYHVIAGRMKKNYLFYKVNLPIRPCSCKKWIIDDDEKTDARGLGKGTKVLRSASS